MFDKLKRALEDFVADQVVGFIDAVDSTDEPPIDTASLPTIASMRAKREQAKQSGQPYTPPSPSNKPPSNTTSLPTIASMRAKREQAKQSGQPPAPASPSNDTDTYERVYKVPPTYAPLTTFTQQDASELIDALDDPNPEQQVHAIQLAHHLMKQTKSQIFTLSETLMMVMLTDPDAPARAAAAEALNVVKKPANKTSPDPIENAGYYHERERYNAIQDALAKTILEDDDLLTRQNAAESLALTGSTQQTNRAFHDLWRKEGDDLDPFIRMVSMIHVGSHYFKRIDDTQRKQREDALIQAYLDYPEIEGMIRQQIQLAKIHRAIPYLMQRFETLDTKNAQAGILTSIGHIGHADAVQPLLALLDGDEYFQSYIIKSLGFIKDASAIAPLQQFKAKLPPRHRLHTLLQETIIQCGEIGSLSEHLDNLKTGDYVQQKTAVLALDQVGTEEAVSALVECLKTTDNGNLIRDIYGVLLKYPTEPVARAIIDRVCDGMLGYRAVSYNFVSKMKMTHALQWLDSAVKTRATPEAMIQIEKDREILRRF